MRFDAIGEQIKRPEWPGTEGSPAPDGPHDGNHMVQIDKLIADLQEIRAKFGNTCCYIRRFGLSWGAVALNYETEDEMNGVFNLQAKYEAILLERGEQVERLVAEKNRWMELASQNQPNQ